MVLVVCWSISVMKPCRHPNFRREVNYIMQIKNAWNEAGRKKHADPCTREILKLLNFASSPGLEIFEVQ